MDFDMHQILLHLLALFVIVSAQNAELDSLKSCNVVCNCNSNERGVLHHSRQPQESQGPPGKLGPKGNPGILGKKGEKGDTGLKGQKGDDVNDELLSQLLSAPSITSCQELRRNYRISSTGYYLMMYENTKTPVYNYCDFRRYTGATTCNQLFNKYNITRRGFYILGPSSDKFHACGPPKTFVGIYTCHELHNRYPMVKESGFYELKSPVEYSRPFRVYCNFSQTPVATEIHHDLIEERLIDSSCEESGCFIAAPSYDIDTSSILKVIDNSESCRQFVKNLVRNDTFQDYENAVQFMPDPPELRCQGVLLSYQGTFNRGWWVARNGDHMKYWGGSTRNGYCGCGETGTCISNSYKCNCDQNSESRITSDEGYLTDKTKLPLRQIQIGDMGGQNEIAWFAIGKLECFGQA